MYHVHRLTRRRCAATLHRSSPAAAPRPDPTPVGAIAATLPPVILTLQLKVARLTAVAPEIAPEIALPAVLTFAATVPVYLVAMVVLGLGARAPTTRSTWR
jgi:hypothetical protein